MMFTLSDLFKLNIACLFLWLPSNGNSLNVLCIMQPDMFGIFGKTPGSPSELEIVTCGFEQFVAAQHEFVLTEPIVGHCLLRG